jgi:hypothetical protein
MEKDYPKDLQQPEYSEFWDNINRKEKPAIRPVSAPRDSREGGEAREADTPRTVIRKKHTALPEITKYSRVKKFDVDLSTLYEDPLFGDYRRKNIRRRL